MRIVEADREPFVASSASMTTLLGVRTSQLCERRAIPLRNIYCCSAEEVLWADTPTKREVRK
jgi:hypothetical protein